MVTLNRDRLFLNVQSQARWCAEDLPQMLAEPREVGPDEGCGDYRLGAGLTHLIATNRAAASAVAHVPDALTPSGLGTIHGLRHACVDVVTRRRIELP